MSDSSPKRKAATLSPNSKKLYANPNKKSGGLELFGLKASKPQKGPYNNDSRIRACLIKNPHDYSIIFRFENKDPDNTEGSWAEKCMFEAVRKREKWTLELGFDPWALDWFDNDVPQKNSRDYSIRMFVIYCDNCPNDKNLLGLAKHVCERVNSLPGNKTTTTVDEEKFLWVQKGAVWSDVLGTDKALADIIKRAGAPEPGYYEKHAQLIHCYFHPKTFGLDLARALHAPIEQIHPDEREDLKKPAKADKDLDATYELSDSENEEEGHEKYEDEDHE